jgi:flagellar hook-length control protein FliK
LNLEGHDFLKTVILGPHLNAITPENTAPNEESLEAFARSQGLDETAVQWLMGSPVQATAAATPTAGAKSTEKESLITHLIINSFNGESTKGVANGMTTGLASEIANGVPINSTSDFETGGDTGLADSEKNGLPSDIDKAVAKHIPNPAHMALNPFQQTGVDPSANSVASRSDALSNGGLLTSAALWALAQQTEKPHTNTPKTDPNTESSDLQITFMRSPPPAALWMQGKSLVNHQTKESPSTKTNVVTSELDLSELASDDLLKKLAMTLSLANPFELENAGAMTTEGSTIALPGEGAPHMSGHTAGHTGQRTDLATTARQEAQNTSPSADDTSATQRSEDIENLSEKMGQAVGQRILSAIEKGQWHLKLMLRPATLGHIEVEIRMRSGELDAVFTAPQALTRELLQDGLSKLKDSLGQMGMNVASMLVGDGQTQQRGGDSTPSQTRKMANSDSKESKSAETQQINIPRTKMGKDGWDVLV